MKRSDLTLEERYLIDNLMRGGFSVGQIGQEIGRHRSTIYNELKRGRTYRGQYCPHRAHWRTKVARLRSGRNAPALPEAFWKQVGKLLKSGLTPDEVSGRMAAERGVVVSFQGIYYRAHTQGWSKHLKSARRRRHLKRPARRRWSGSALPLQRRPEEAARLIERGHFEADSMIGRRSDRQRVVVVVERQTLFTLLILVRVLTAQAVARQIRRRLDASGLPFLSITTDRGPEFTALGDAFTGQAYVCDPHAPNQRGINENQIGRLRIDMPKGHSMNDITPAKLTRIQNKHNNTPRKALEYKTPNEIAFNRPPPVGICF